MLTAETKRRIQSARDILVGQLPLPTDQVELITIALIYKFMDDIDEEARSIGGKASFFTGGLRDLSWRHIISNTLSADARVIKLTQGIEAISDPKNTQIPELFKSIFRNAFLKFRDGRTLKLFLDEINGFTYDHSEELGNAFEFILESMGVQADNGQFRTPRHIIEFIVDVVDPQKNETILDPACGTAGFLISAYKHIMAANTSCSAAVPAAGLGGVSPRGNTRGGTPRELAGEDACATKTARIQIGNLLKSGERDKLTRNVVGYDITPLMCRLSRVNMYLHHFSNPVIHEYNTLANKNRWDDKADVILANPPFMTPKGGIRPHDRFAISANRSEVLFVDYIAEHLNPAGRAGIIVPEGIIFQSQNAYKELRRMLVDGFLWAVVSLPAGVFNPYSGVKTSILFLDRALAKQNDEVLFVKVENDGFGLGAQRREIELNDFPAALRALQEWKQPRINTDKHGSKKEIRVHPCPSVVQTLPVSRKRILESPDISLSGDRYRAVAVRGNGKWPMVKLDEAAEISMGQSPGGESYNDNGKGVPLINGPVEFGPTAFSTTLATKFTTKPTKMCKAGDVILCVRGSTTGRMNIASRESCIGRGVAAIRSEYTPYLSFIINSLQDRIHILGSRSGSTFPNINSDALAEIEIPVPPLAEQERLVAELEGYRRVIESARQILAHYKPTLRLNPSWPSRKIGEVCKVESGFGFSPDEQGKTTEEIPFLKVSDMNLAGNERFIKTWNHTVSRAVLSKLRGEAFPKGTVIFPKIGAAIATNKKRILTIPSTYDNNVMGIIPGKEVDSLFLHAWLLSFDLSEWASQSTPPSMRKTTVEETEIPVPPLAEQRALVAELEAERALVEANRELAVRFEQKLQTKLSEIWGAEAAEK